MANINWIQWVMKKKGGDGEEGREVGEVWGTGEAGGGERAVIWPKYMYTRTKFSGKTLH